MIKRVLCILLFLLLSPIIGYAVDVELLVRNFDGPAGRKAGDIVTVKILPHKGWGRGEGSPSYTIIKLTDIDSKKIAELKKRHVTTYDKESKPTGTVRSKYRLPVSSLSSETQAEVTLTGKTSIKWSVADTLIMDEKSAVEAR